jgi:putative selenate reductase molybdopterin-binding subunit
LACARDLHVFTERVGGGFGGKQEMISEDLCLLATMKTGRPVKWEFTREEQFIGATTRHQMTTRVKLGAKQDGTLTAIEVHVVSNTGGYGGHASETLGGALGSPLSSYRCANKKAVGYAVYTNQVPGGGFRGYGSSQTTFAIESAIDDFARLLGIDPFEIRRKNMVRPNDWIESVWKDPSDVGFGSYGLDQCLDLVEGALAKGGGLPKPEGDEWAEGTGVALAMLENPPTEHRSGALMTLRPDGTYHLAIGSTEMGNGSVTSHRQIAAAILGASAASVDIINADTDLCPYDSGTFGSTGTVVAGKAVNLTAEALRDNIVDFASRHAGVERSACRLEGRTVVCGEQRIALMDLHVAGSKAGHRFEAKRRSYLSPRTVAFNVHGIRLAVHRVTGEIRILHSVHAADIGRLINPMQCRGQIDGAIAMGFGWALTEKMVYDDAGKMVNPALRNYRIPAFADVPHTQVFFADTHDAIGPLGAKAQGECAINPVAPAIANALANATKIRFAHLPFTPDRIFDKLAASCE